MQYWTLDRDFTYPFQIICMYVHIYVCVTVDVHSKSLLLVLTEHIRNYIYVRTFHRGCMYILLHLFLVSFKFASFEFVHTVDSTYNKLG